MLTKERTSKTRKLKYAAVALALLAVLVFCFASCGKATPTGIEYVENTASKLVYNLGETFDCTGAQVKVTYANGAEETVAVTPEMVGTAPLTFGMESVTVTYSENGATVVGHIPVTVVDPNAALKADTITKLAEGEKVVARKNDGGVALLLEDCSAKINAATSVDAINALVSNFEADLDDYIAKKEAIVAKFGDEALVKKIATLYTQYKKDIDTAEATAKANIAAASTLDEAETYYLQFVIAVDNKLAEQKHIEDKEGGNKGQIYDKIELLYILEDYLEKVKFFEGLVNAAYAKDENGNLTGEAWALYDKVEDAQAFYDKVMFAEKPTADDEDPFWSYKAIKQEIDYMEKYITLAIDLSSIDLQAKIGNPLLTEVDTAVSEYLLNPKGITVRPAAYKDGVVDEVDALFTNLNELFGTAKKKYGATGLESLKAEYGQPANAAADSDNYINDLIELIQTKYEYLNGQFDDQNNLLVPGVRTATAEIIELIDAAYAATFDIVDGVPVLKTGLGVANDPQDQAIKTAWTKIADWNNDKFITMTGDGTVDIWVTYDKKIEEVIYTANGFDTTKQKWTNVTDKWTADAVTEDYVKTYFIPNIDKLIEASQARYAAQVMDAINKLDPDSVVYSTTTAIDSKAAIENAEYYYNAFRKAYVTGKGANGEDDYTIYNKYFVDNDANGKADCAEKLAAARTNYDNLVTLANEANEAIGTYMLSIGSSTDNIKLSDFADGVEFNLKDAYTKYLDFAEANGAVENAGNPAYTNVITNRTELIDYVKYYNDKLAYVEERNVESRKTINRAWDDRDDKVMNDKEVVPPTDFRDNLQKLCGDLIEYIQTDAKYDYVALPTITYYEGENKKTRVITDANEEFYLVEILNHNVENVKTAATNAATYITNTTYTTDFSVNPLA